MLLITKILQIIFSIYVWSFAFAWMALISLIYLFISPFVPYEKTHNYISAPAFALVIRMALIRLKVIYDKDFDPKRPSVFCQNHVNLLDAHTASSAIPHAFCGLMNAWQFKIPFYGWMMKFSRGIPVLPGTSQQRLQGMIYAAQTRRDRGMSILTFPEAHRTRDGKVHRFQRGIFTMAREAGYPVVPIAVRGMYEVNRKGTYLFKPGNVTIYVGKQIETKNLSDEEMGQLKDRLHSIITNFVEHGTLPNHQKAAEAA